jgi:4-diphosphocytidyl-2-C-methyl-D-erythritol kinase
MPAFREIAYAKVNLALHVRHRRADGYHELETLFAFARDGDQISAELADDISITITGPFGEGLDQKDNLVVRAAQMMKEHFAIGQGAAIALGKHLPVASGIGGGSADAAATARLVNKLWDINADDRELEQLLAPLGADIPACVQSRTVYGEGVGGVLRAVSGEDITGRALLLVNPLQPVPTGPVFEAWDGVDRGPLPDDDPWQVALTGRNDLEAPAISIWPAIGDVLQELGQTGADLFRMSGSGATCFAIYASADDRDAAQALITEACPDWWTMASFLR